MRPFSVLSRKKFFSESCIFRLRKASSNCLANAPDDGSYIFFILPFNGRSRLVNATPIQ